MSADVPPFSVDIRVVQRKHVDAAEIWPDGDAPAHPTVADVVAAIKGTTDEARNVLSTWDDVEVYVDDQRVEW